ncbi:MAG: GH92 family glycosyl hydrolase [Bacteroidota bacterium]|nr:GH92 family glycosyl hydrolase [Bacteroidota bacterium]
MRSISYSIIFNSFFFIISILKCQSQSLPADKVNMMLGTWGSTGGLVPGVTSPFGMTSFVPMTRYNRVGTNIYQYEDTTYLLGFRGTHQPTVWMGDYGYHTLWTGYGVPKVTAKDRRMRYSHKKEKASPYSYSTPIWEENKPENKIDITFTASSRCAYYQFNYAQSGSIYVGMESINTKYPAAFYRLKQTQLHDDGLGYGYNVSATGYAQYNPERNELSGYNTDIQSAIISPQLKNFKGYFVIQFNKKISAFGTWKDSTLYSGQSSIKGNLCGAYVTFDIQKNEILECKVGTSFISVEQARQNLNKEIGNKSYETFELENKNKWNEALQRISIETKDKEKETMFYTFLFHSMQYPREMDEYGKFYSAAHDSILSGTNYTDFSLWDTFRAAHPLLCITSPERVSNMIKAMLTFYKGTGRLPIWPNPMETNIMIGSHSNSVIAEAYLKGFKDFDISLAYEAIRKDGSVPPPNDESNLWADRDPWTTPEGRGGLSHYLAKGYVASDITKEAPARTLEYAYDDYCIAQMALKLGKKQDYEQFMNQSMNFKNIFSPEFGFFMARRKDGTFSKDTLEGFTEGTYWNFAFWAPHAPEELVKLYGGKDAFAAKINRFYSKDGHKSHGNEQIHHYPYLYHYIDQPRKVQETVAKTIETYKNTPWGIGNEDCGQMGAWFVFNCLGLYPMNPCKNEYEIGTPIIDKAIIKGSVMNNTKDLIITVNRTDKNQIYIKEVRYNNIRVTGHTLPHDILIKGGKLEFVMMD